MLIYMEVKVSVFCGEGSSFLSELMSFSCVALKCLFSFLLKNEIAVIISSDGSAVKNLPALQEVWETWVLSPGQEDPLEEEMATACSILAWRIPWTEEPHGLESVGLQRDTSEHTPIKFFRRN